jgi:hypothetical protein
MGEEWSAYVPRNAEIASCRVSLVAWKNKSLSDRPIFGDMNIHHAHSSRFFPSSSLPSACALNPLLPPNARVAVIGDSITEQKIYSKYIETYLLACTGRSDIKVFQFGWSGERAGGFAARLENDLAVFNPNVATTCYGMNDGSYTSLHAADRRRV